MTIARLIPTALALAVFVFVVTEVMPRLGAILEVLS